MFLTSRFFHIKTYIIEFRREVLALYSFVSSYSWAYLQWSLSACGAYISTSTSIRKTEWKNRWSFFIKILFTSNVFAEENSELCQTSKMEIGDIRLADSIEITHSLFMELESINCTLQKLSRTQMLYKSKNKKKTIK